MKRGEFRIGNPGLGGLTTEGTEGHGGLAFSLCDIWEVATGNKVFAVMRAGVSG